ncbi:hypothetical protein AURDEDRAFT_177054 [Auricularia subglabra TFB-10046 SS5]|uniref:Uncharacterized protein n=1 Tax=Auricularia subglabra (strain TFB-10046 / SS5) TaxID=717982 RepID=J0WNC8_AURST|nr:hypothetical protein AURDEDRAFT_177054 [Auricularia subglabra TFB-10046 SS5]
MANPLIEPVVLRRRQDRPALYFHDGEAQMAGGELFLLPPTRATPTAVPPTPSTLKPSGSALRHPPVTLSATIAVAPSEVRQCHSRCWKPPGALIKAYERGPRAVREVLMMLPSSHRCLVVEPRLGGSGEASSFVERVSEPRVDSTLESHAAWMPAHSKDQSRREAVIEYWSWVIHDTRVSFMNGTGEQVKGNHVAVKPPLLAARDRGLVPGNIGVVRCWSMTLSRPVSTAPALEISLGINEWSRRSGSPEAEDDMPSLTLQSMVEAAKRADPRVGSASLGRRAVPPTSASALQRLHEVLHLLWHGAGARLPPPVPIPCSFVDICMSARVPIRFMSAPSKPRRLYLRGHRRPRPSSASTPIVPLINLCRRCRRCSVHDDFVEVEALRSLLHSSCGFDIKVCFLADSPAWQR